MSVVGGSSFRNAPGAGVAPKLQTMEEKLKDAAKMYERSFLQEMVKAMRSTVQENGFMKPSNAEKIFRDELDQEFVNTWSEDRGGIGLADMIYNNLTERYGPQLGIKKAVEKPVGPIALNQKSLFVGTAAKLPSAANETRFKMDLKAPADSNGPLEPTPLLMPWDGKLKSKTPIENDSYLLDVQHENGLNSKFVIKGQPTPGTAPGQDLSAGSPIALLSPESKSFFWTLVPKEPTNNE